MPWQLQFILPNLCLNANRPTPFVTDFVCICSGDDERVEALADTPGDRTGKAMLGKFRNWFGRKYTPTCLLVRTDAPAVYRNQDVLRSFRNLCAIGTTTYCAARVFDGDGWVPTYSDFFFLAAHAPGHTGRILHLDGPVVGAFHRPDDFAGQCAGQIDMPASFSVLCDKEVLRRLVQAWHNHYVRRPRDRGVVPLFRSLEVAFQAGRFPSDGLVSLSDIGTRIGLWVSAFEILFHPGARGSVNRKVVQQALLPVRSMDTYRERRRRYNATWGGHPYKVDFAGYCYGKLYDARNTFMHGNPIGAKHVRLQRRGRSAPLLDIAPLLYNVGVRAYTEPAFKGSDHEMAADVLAGRRILKNALMEIGGFARRR